MSSIKDTQGKNIAAKMSKIYYSPVGYWKGKVAIDKLASTAGVTYEQAKHYLQQQAIWQIYLNPPRKIVRPHFENYIVNDTHQMDLLFLPHDTVNKKRYKYALTVIDIASRFKDAEPLTDKNSNTVAAALSKIYGRGNLKYPRLVQVDDGGEFKASVNQLFAKHGVLVRRGIPGNHRSQAIVENFNKQLAERLFSYQYSKELMHDTRNTEWVKRLPAVLRAMNNEGNPKPIDAIKLKTIDTPPPTLKLKTPDTSLFTKQVRYLYQPGEAEGDEKRRATDPIWSVSVHNVKKIVPGNPSIYYLYAPAPQRAFVKEELQIVPTGTVTQF